MPGTADITPRRPVAQAGQLGQVLARIHQTPVDRLAELPSALSQAGGSLAGLSGPAADVAAANWDIVAGTPSVLVHYDFWSGNVVWQDEVLSGVVDWTGGCLGPPGFDIGLRAVVPGLADSVLPE
jgi:aminoglycoside phosphotransferase (APT) family kinase protein